MLRRFRWDELEATIDESFAAEFGSKPMPPEKIEHPKTPLGRAGRCRPAEADLTTERYIENIHRADYEPMMAVLQREHARLSALPDGEPTFELVCTGKTLGHQWAALDMAGKGRLLRHRD